MNVSRKTKRWLRGIGYLCAVFQLFLSQFALWAPSTNLTIPDKLVLGACLIVCGSSMAQLWIRSYKQDLIADGRMDAATGEMKP